MASRVEKYHSEQDYATERSQKNQNLYDAISELDKTTEKVSVFLPYSTSYSGHF